MTIELAYDGHPMETAAIELVAHAESAAGRRQLAAKKQALPDGSFPVPDVSHLKKAIRAIGRVASPAKRAAVKALIKRRARELGVTGSKGVKGTWAFQGSSRRIAIELAARGVRDPEATAAWIARRGSIELASVQHTHTHSHEGGDRPHTHNDGDYDNDSARGTGAAGTTVPRAPGQLRTPARAGRASTGVSQSQYTVRGGSPNMGLSRTEPGVELAAPLHPRLAVTGPFDYMINRSDDDPSIVTVRHRRGGDVIGQIAHLEDGTWQGRAGDSELGTHTRQRAALLELLGAHNRSVVQAGKPMPLQSPPVQTPLMQQLGIENIRAFATPANGMGDGPRMATAGGSGSGSDSGGSGLTPKGQAIYKKLLARGFPAARAMAFAKHAQNMSAGKFKKAS